MTHPIRSLNPQLIFQGQCGDALDLYTRALGADLVLSMRYAEMPGGTIPEARKSWYAHARIRLGGGVVMLSDDPFFDGGDACLRHPAGNGTIHVEFENPDVLREHFTRLASEGGSVILAPHDTFWGAVYGSMIDRLGVGWDFHFDKTAR